MILKSTIHEGERAHQCQICGTSFGRVGILFRRHLATVHEGQKEHDCQSCDKSFGQAGHFITHMKTVHEGENSPMSNLWKKF